MTLTISKTTNGHGEAAVTDGAVQADPAPSVECTLRDLFAMQALIAVTPEMCREEWLELVTVRAYKIADFMLKTRGAQ